jgi:high-affinity iron transporter
VLRRTALSVIGLLALLAALTGLATSAALAAQADPADSTPSTWVGVADQMGAVLDDAHGLYLDGDAEAAKDRVDDAYYGSYEKLGFEKIVMGNISGARASAVEYQFSQSKQVIMAGADQAEVRAELDTLAAMLHEDAVILDGTRSSPVKAFLGSLTIILREGLEAILVVAAIVAYLVKAGRRDQLRTVYIGTALALVASVGLAVAFNALTALAGANQEIIEGVTVLIAAAMLIWVSNWIAGKSNAQAWTGYLKDKTGAAVGSGSARSLAFVAFLAVFREGAETILFYQALSASSGANPTAIWSGLGIGLVGLAGVYLAIRYLSIRIPMRPFFLATSILLAVMAVAFAGSGIKELQEGNVVPVTQLAGLPTIDLVGIYPTVQTLVCQGAVLALVVASFALATRRARRPRAETPAPSQSPTAPALETTP